MQCSRQTHSLLHSIHTLSPHTHTHTPSELEILFFFRSQAVRVVWETDGAIESDGEAAVAATEHDGAEDELGGFVPAAAET
jgi:hypothetical protein